LLDGLKQQKEKIVRLIGASVAYYGQRFCSS